MRRFLQIFGVVAALSVPASAQMLVPIVGDTHQSAGGGTAWSNTDNAAIALTTTTTTNDTARSNSAGAYTGVRGTASYTGKVYAEFYLTSWSVGGPYNVFGFCNASSNLSGAQCGLQDSNGIVIAPASTNMVWSTNSHNAAAFGVVPTTADTVAVAFDIPGNLMWWRYNRSASWSAWNADALSDPSTGAVGNDITTGAPTGPFYLYFENYSNTTDQIQMKCSGFLGAVPTGFSAC